MSNLSEASKYRNSIITGLLSNTDIVKALVYSERDFASKPLPNDPFTLLLHKQIFPYEKLLSETPMMQTSYLTLKIDATNPTKNNNIFTDIDVYVNVICHIELMQTDYGQLRHEYLASRIDEMMNKNKNKKFSIGNLERISAREWGFTDTHSGYILQYRTTDLRNNFL